VTLTSLVVAPASGTYGGATTLSATLTAACSLLSGQTVAFSLNSQAVGVAQTDAGGMATLTGVSLAGVYAGTFSSSVGASYGGTAAYAASTESGALTVGKASLTVTADDQQRPFGAPNPVLTVKLSGFVAGEAVLPAV